MAGANHKRYKTRKRNSIKKPMKEAPILIKNWDELYGLESDEWIIRQGHGGYGAGEVVRKTPIVNPKSHSDNWHYLSTHTFYGKTHHHSTAVLQSLGFNVIIDNWDKDYPERN